jgi:hypothetical protein
VVDGVGQLRVLGALCTRRQPVELLASFFRLEEVEATVNAVVG